MQEWIRTSPPRIWRFSRRSKVHVGPAGRSSWRAPSIRTSSSRTASPGTSSPGPLLIYEGLEIKRYATFSEALDAFFVEEEVEDEKPSGSQDRGARKASGGIRGPGEGDEAEGRAGLPDLRRAVERFRRGGRCQGQGVLLQSDLGEDQLLRTAPGSGPSSPWTARARCGSCWMDRSWSWMPA